MLFFMGRGLIMLQTPDFVNRRWVRRVAESIDMILFSTGVLLAWMTSQTPWGDVWLAAKLGMLLVYILLGMIAFHWAKSRSVKFGAWFLALGVLAIIVSIALTRNPWPFEAWGTFFSRTFDTLI